MDNRYDREKPPGHLFFTKWIAITGILLYNNIALLYKFIDMLILERKTL